MTGEESRIGEVIEACTTYFVSQCYELYHLPPLGSLVKTRVESTELFGIVYNAATTSLEPGRRPIARGKDETSEEEIYRSNPQLVKLLKSEFNSLVIGYRDDKLHQYLPPAPARIHAFVYQCSPEELRELSQSLGFLTMLINAPLPIPVDELIAASLRQMSHVHEDRHAFLVSAGKELAMLLNGEFKRLKAILESIK